MNIIEILRNFYLKSNYSTVIYQNYSPRVPQISELLITPKISFIMNGSQSNSNKISNELSTNNNYDQLSFVKLNRYTSDDKLDNSKRINFGFNIKKNNLSLNLLESYEFQKNSNYQKDLGDKDHLSDLLGTLKYDNTATKIEYNIFCISFKA